MAEFKLYSGNKLESLGYELAHVLKNPLGSPLAGEVIIVQSKGMERWISMRLAESFGICANCNYFFPNQLIANILKSVIPEATDERFFDKDIITWKIMKLLPQCYSQKEFVSIKDYIEVDELKNYQLSSRIADTFDQYLTFRPEMIIEWDQKKNNSWQALLWRLLMKELPLCHPPAQREIFFDKIKDIKNLNIDSLPERISVFGISSLPLFHLDILAGISEFIDVNLFLMNPSREYWADIYSEHRIAGSIGKHKNGLSTTEELHLEKGNSLLASMGKLGADFISLIMRYYEPQDIFVFDEPGYDLILHSIQSDILGMIDRGTSNQDEKQIEISNDNIIADASIRINSCHSPMREVEVLYDNILNMFNNDSELDPEDILVMTPDIELYSPFIQAIFSDSPRDGQKIPFSITDRSIRGESRTIDAFFAILDLAGSRFGANKVLDILEREGVQKKFNLTFNDLDKIREWVKRTRINWGIDGEDRGKFGLPEFNHNTWKAGLDRLLLGYAMPGNEESIFENILPYDYIEGNESLILGKFIEFFKLLSSSVKFISNSFTLSRWSDILIEVLDRFFDPEEDIEAFQIIRDTICKLKHIEDQAGFQKELDFKIIRSWLENIFSEKKRSSGFLTGGITFCAMLPMRGIPFKVICLIGMNDNSFPKSGKTVGFDLIAQNPKTGDRCQRNDDRYLFLESIISVREKLYISYVGQGIQDNSEIPPSVVVSELLDYIEQGYNTTEKGILAYILIKHPLQAFSSRYFSGKEELISYSQVNCNAAKITARERAEFRPFITNKLTDSYIEDKVIYINDLIQFFNNPVKFLLNKRLGIYLMDKIDLIDEREPFDALGLDRYKIEEMMCENYLTDNTVDSLQELIRARGMFPHGVMGDLVFKNMIPGVKIFAEKVKTYINFEKPKPVDIHVKLSEYSVTGRIDNLFSRGVIQYRYANTKARDRLRYWITHLALNAAENYEYPGNSILIGKDVSWETEPVSNSREILYNLIKIYAAGGNELIHFFAETSFEYAEIMLQKGARDKALAKAVKKWTGDDFTIGDGSDIYNNLCFGNSYPFNKNFEEISISVFEPVISLQKKINQ